MPRRHLLGCRSISTKLLLLAASALASCPNSASYSDELLNFISRRTTDSETRWFPDDDGVIVSKAVCLRDDKWWSFGPNGTDDALRRRYCQSKEECFSSNHMRCSRALCFRPNGPWAGCYLPTTVSGVCHVSGATAGGLAGVVFPGVVPIGLARNETTSRVVKPYKRCEWKYRELPKRGGRKRRQHVEFFPPTSAERRAQVDEHVRWIKAPLLLATDSLHNVGHAVRDLLMLNAVARRWRRGGGGLADPLYLLDASRRPLPWVVEYAAAIAKHHGVERFAPERGRTYCFRAVVQKGVGETGDAENARSMRDAVLSHCGESLTAAPTGLLYIVHGKTEVGDRELRNFDELDGALKATARELGLTYRAVEFTSLTFCEQVKLIADARFTIGVFGAAIAGNFLFSRDRATTIEITACPHSKGAPLPLTGAMAERGPDGFPLTVGRSTFQDDAVTLGKGFTIFCVCIGPDETDLYAFFANKTHGWLQSRQLTANTDAMTRALRALHRGDTRAASAATAAAPCAHQRA